VFKQFSTCTSERSHTLFYIQIERERSENEKH
jgi:hypothetical protein